MTETAIKPGIYFDMPEDEYRAAPGLSQSALKDLEVSPLRYWHLHINPNRPAERVTPELTFGKALHCMVLEPKAFVERYACELDAADYPGCLSTMDQLKDWLKSNGLPTTAKNKQELMDRVQQADPLVPILDLLERGHAKRNAGKVLLGVEDWKRVRRCHDAIASEPRVAEILENGRFEVSYFVDDPDTGVRLKARMDWVPDNLTFDLKSFSQKRGKSIDRSIADAIYYEGYDRQGYFYSRVRRIAENKPRLPFILGFVESDEPHETRLAEIGPGDPANVYWEVAGAKTRGLIQLYADCWKRWGVKPWREEQRIQEIVDQDIPQLAWS